jgi:hypothetical protein
LPSDGNTVVDPTANKTVFTWQPSVGADQYKVFLFDNPSLTGSPIKVSPVLVNPSVSAGGTMSWRLNTALDPSTTYYWVVGASRSGEAAPFVHSTGTKGAIFSSVYRFTTSPTPPPPPSSATVGTAGAKGHRPADRPGWWQGADR